MKTLLLALLLAGCHPLLAQPVYINPSNQAHNLEPLVKFAVWSISERAGINAYYAGTTDAHCENGKIIVRSYTAEEWEATGIGHRAFAFTADCGTGFIVVFSPYYAPQQWLVTHEIAGHAMGYFQHSADQYDVMYPYRVNPLRMLTTNDVNNIRANSVWPITRPASLCHIEIDPAKTFIIPSINGLRIVMGYLGVVDGYQTWVQLYTARTSQSCPNTSLSNGIATLNDIRSMSGNYQSATFEYMGGISWRLTSLTP